MPVACPLLATISLCWLAASSLWIYPHSLSYFNESIGGPLNGPEHLLGSNVDWGQDAAYVKHLPMNLGLESTACMRAIAPSTSAYRPLAIPLRVLECDLIIRSWNELSKPGTSPFAAASGAPIGRIAYSLTYHVAPRKQLGGRK